ncbi:hypothetical protein SAMN05216365_11810 [Porphyromonadaceae bacterium NLAE-zl-C104]|nr:hypothetical protein SAMN05216365_11810 [Porphyromonadaceae bacterium NLAE-zl-C104]
MQNQSKKVTRREFLGLSALGLTSLTILPSWTMNGVRIAPSDRVVLGFIGLGRQGIGDFHAFTHCPGVQVVAGCDSVRSRKEPIAPVEAGASTNIFFCNVNIAHELGRPVKWDPVTKRYFDDKEAEAHRLYYYEYRNPYKLPYRDRMI